MTTTLITGASSGLGAEMARQLAAHGEDLALCARRTDRLEELRAEILAAHPGRRVALRTLDVTDPDQVPVVFEELRAELGGLDRVVVNAGLGKGAPLGTGQAAVNRETATTNFLGALAQTEAAMEIFRAQRAGHLVMVSSMSAMRGMPKSMTTYAATKIGAAFLAEGLRTELHGTELGRTVDVTVLYPGYIASEMNEQVAQRTPLMASTEKGVRSMVAAIEKRTELRLRAGPALGADVRGDAARAAGRAQASALSSSSTSRARGASMRSSSPASTWLRPRCSRVGPVASSVSARYAASAAPPHGRSASPRAKTGPRPAASLTTRCGTSSQRRRPWVRSETTSSPTVRPEPSTSTASSANGTLHCSSTCRSRHVRQVEDVDVDDAQTQRDRGADRDHEDRVAGHPHQPTAPGDPARAAAGPPVRCGAPGPRRPRSRARHPGR